MAGKLLNTAVIVAAGTGQRFGGQVPKQFVELLGRPLILHTIERFELCLAIDEIVLVAAKDRLSDLNQLLAEFKFSKVKSVVPGGETRSISVLNGINAIEKGTAGIVAVHDGARPLVTGEEITMTVEAASIHGAACLVADVTDTVKEVHHGFITGTVPRAKLRRALTPQAFQYAILSSAFDRYSSDEAATDECSIVERSGIRIFCVPGSSRNIKITTPDDLTQAEAFLRSENRL
jgi:2-C-methyl-D-erythritol 4-phosphate cytidylyltransferase